MRSRRRVTPAWVKCALLDLPVGLYASAAQCLRRYNELLVKYHVAPRKGWEISIGWQTEAAIKEEMRR